MTIKEAAGLLGLQPTWGQEWYVKDSRLEDNGRTLSIRLFKPFKRRGGKVRVVVIRQTDSIALCELVANLAKLLHVGMEVKAEAKREEAETLAEERRQAVGDER